MAGLTGNGEHEDDGNPDNDQRDGHDGLRYDYVSDFGGYSGPSWLPMTPAVGGIAGPPMPPATRAPAGH